MWLAKSEEKEGKFWAKMNKSKQRKLKPRWVKTNIPTDIKVKYHWKAMVGRMTYEAWQQAMASMDWEEADRKWYRDSRDTYKSLQDEIWEMPSHEIEALPPDLKSWIKDVRRLDRGPQERPVDEHAHAEVDTSYIGLAEEAKEQAIAHDVAIFEKSDMIMNEQDLEIFLNTVHDSYRQSQTIMIAEFCEFFEYETNKYIPDTLKRLVKTLCKALSSLLAFLAYHVGDFAWQTPRHPNHTYVLWPELQKIMAQYNKEIDRLLQLEEKGLEDEAQELEIELDARFKEQVNKLEDLEEELLKRWYPVIGAYRDYRIYIRQTLYL